MPYWPPHWPLTSIYLWTPHWPLTSLLTLWPQHDTHLQCDLTRLVLSEDLTHSAAYSVRDLGRKRWRYNNIKMVVYKGGGNVLLSQTGFLCAFLCGLYFWPYYLLIYRGVGSYGTFILYTSCNYCWGTYFRAADMMLRKFLTPNNQQISNIYLH